MLMKASSQSLTEQLADPLRRAHPQPPAAPGARLPSVRSAPSSTA
jgi:hypothetical protein